MDRVAPFFDSRCSISHCCSSSSSSGSS